MNQETMFKEILNALKVHGEKVDKRFDQVDQRFDQVDRRFEAMDKKIDNLGEELRREMRDGFAQVNRRVDRLEKKFDGMQVELMETKENTNFALSKIIQHEKKLQHINNQQS